MVANMQFFRNQIIENLRGGFAPNTILLREFHYSKAGIILEGLHFSAWILLGHIHERHKDFLKFVKNPNGEINLWPEAYWPANYQPKNEEEWNMAINAYEKDLNAMIDIMANPTTDLFKIHNRKYSISQAALMVAHHTGYHIGQLKTIGRQLGVW